MRLSTVIIFLVALVLIYLAYNFFFKGNASTVINTNATNNIPNIPSVTPVNTSTVNNICDKLPDEKIKIDLLYNAAQDAFIKYSDSVAGAFATQIQEAKGNEFKSAEYYYKSAIISYNGIIASGNCGGVSLLEPIEFTYKGTVSSGTNGTGNIVVNVPVGNPINCNLGPQKNSIDFAEQQVNFAYSQYQMANLNNKYSTYQYYVTKYNDYSKQIDDYNNLATRCFNEQGVQINFLTKINFYNN